MLATYLPGFGGGKRLHRLLQSVKRFVRKLRVVQPERIWRLECQPGEGLQLDFGLGAPIDDGQGKKRRGWVLRMVLSYSRKAYSEAVTRQDTETFLRCLENGLRTFGGSTLLLNLDNMKAGTGRIMSWPCAGACETWGTANRTTGRIVDS